MTRKMLIIRLVDEYHKHGNVMTSVMVLEPNERGGKNSLFHFYVEPGEAEALQLAIDSMLIALDYDTAHEHGEWRE